MKGIERTFTNLDVVKISGDALGIYPQNRPEEVCTLLQAMGCTGLKPVPKPTWAYQLPEQGHGIFLPLLHLEVKMRNGKVNEDFLQKTLI